MCIFNTISKYLNIGVPIAIAPFKYRTIKSQLLCMCHFQLVLNLRVVLSHLIIALLLSRQLILQILYDLDLSIVFNVEVFLLQFCIILEVPIFVFILFIFKQKLSYSISDLIISFDELLFVNLNLIFNLWRLTHSIIKTIISKF